MKLTLTTQQEKAAVRYFGQKLAELKLQPSVFNICIVAAALKWPRFGKLVAWWRNRT